MSDKIEIDLSVEGAQQKLEALRAQAATLKQELQSVGDALASKPNATNAANFFQTSAQLGVVNSAIGAIESSGVTGGTAATSGASPFAQQPRMMNIADPSAAMQMLQTQGVSSGTMAQALPYLTEGKIPVTGGAFNAGAYLQQVLSTGQANNPHNPFMGAAAVGPSTSLDNWQMLSNTYAVQQNPNNPFAGAAAQGPSSPIGSPGLGLNTYLMQQAQQRQLAIGAFGVAAGYQAAQLAANVANTYTHVVASGQADPLGYGSTYGNAGGFAVGAGIGFLAGGPVGALAGGLIGATVGGPMINAAQASYVRDSSAGQIVAPYAILSGADAAGVNAAGKDISRRADAINQSFLTPEDSWENVWRRLGLYTGTDKTSSQTDAKTEASLRGGWLNAGMPVSDWLAHGMADRLSKKYGDMAPDVAASYAKALGAIPSTGGNTTDLLRLVGVEPTVTMLRENGLPYDKDALSAFNARITRGEYRSGKLRSGLEMAESDYEASGYAGRSTRDRQPEFAREIGAMRSYAGSLQSELTAIEHGPDGPNSALAATKRALLAAAQKDIEAALNNQARSMVSDTMSAGQTRLAGAQVRTLQANLYGGPGDFAPAAANTVAQLGIEERELRQELNNPNLDFATKQGMKQRLFAIQSEKMSAPAQAAVASANRVSLYGQVRESNAGLSVQNADLFGTDADVQAAAGGSIAGRQQTIAELTKQLNNPALPVEARAGVMMQINRERAAMQTDQVGARDVLLGRMAGRSQVAETTANVALQMAQGVGTGADVRAAGMGSVAALESEQAQISEQLKAGGLTVDQQTRLRQRQAEIPGQVFATKQSVIDTGYAKDDIVGYGLPSAKLAGALQRAELAPFAPGNYMALELGQAALSKNQLGVLSQREDDLRKSGNLSPEREMAIEQQRQGLLTQIDVTKAHLSDGIMERLPALAANAGPRFQGRYTTAGLAAIRLDAAGIDSTRVFGAANGRAQARQDAHWAGLDNADGPHMPSKGMQGNNAGNGEVVAVLREILSAVRGGTTRGNGRAAEGVGTGAAMLQRAGVGDGSGSPFN